ncbi:MAG: hypothetical protein KDA92_11815, partial [Planctomycetales bacterium]|nr:hypothetical protein [Planctomycetales bacterium]
MKTLMTLIGLTLGVWSLLESTSILAAPIIDPGTIYLAPDYAGQAVPLYVSGGDAVQGLNLHVSVEQGGPDFSPTGKLGPVITDVDVTNRTIFAGRHDGQTTIADFPQAWVVATATTSGTVSANGILAWITFDTTGLLEGAGPFSLTLEDPAGVPSDFAGIGARLSAGQLVISGVPEPDAGQLGAIG